MNIEYNVTEDDFINFNFFHRDLSEKWRRFMLIMNALCAVLLCMFFVIALNGIVSTAFGIAAGLAWFYLFPRYEKRLTGKSIKKHIQEGKSSEFIGLQKLTLHDNFIESANSVSSATIPYANVERIGFGYNCIFVYARSAKPLIIPVSAFAGKDHIDSFVGLLKDKTNIEPTGNL